MFSFTFCGWCGRIMVYSMDKGGYLWKENIRFIATHSQMEKGTLGSQTTAIKDGEMGAVINIKEKFTMR